METGIKDEKENVIIVTHINNIERISVLKNKTIYYNSFYLYEQHHYYESIWDINTYRAVRRDENGQLWTIVEPGDESNYL
jgi:hypothetical protein